MGWGCFVRKCIGVVCWVMFGVGSWGHLLGLGFG